jgi:membrane fusion protein (multidrug efflux system)
VVLFDRQTHLVATEEAIVERIIIPFDRRVVRNQNLVHVYYPDTPRRYDSLAAPAAGEVGDIHVRQGQRLLPGDVVLSIFPDDAELEVVGILPGHYRPQLERGRPLRLELAGYEYTYQDLDIQRVGNEVVGPDTARRYLGRELADALPISGPVVLVHARLENRTFESQGRSYDFHHGMQGLARVQVRSQRIIYTLAPWLKPLFHDRDG